MRIHEQMQKQRATQISHSKTFQIIKINH